MDMKKKDILRDIIDKIFKIEKVKQKKKKLAIFNECFDYLQKIDDELRKVK